MTHVSIVIFGILAFVSLLFGVLTVAIFTRDHVQCFYSAVANVNQALLALSYGVSEIVQVFVKHCTALFLYLRESFGPSVQCVQFYK